LEDGGNSRSEDTQKEVKDKVTWTRGIDMDVSERTDWGCVVKPC
jgi:hypothetical protein